MNTFELADTPFGPFLLVHYEYYPEIPGVYSGPPERCYPSEPEEVSYYLILKKGDQAIDVTDFLDPNWHDDIVSQIRHDWEMKGGKA